MASCHVFKKRGAGLACTPHPPTETREALDAAGGCLRPRRAYKLRGSATQLHSRSEEDWSIRSKRWQDKLLCYRVVYKRILSNFPRPQEQLRIIWRISTSTSYCLNCLAVMATKLMNQRGEDLESGVVFMIRIQTPDVQCKYLFKDFIDLIMLRR